MSKSIKIIGLVVLLLGGGYLAYHYFSSASSASKNVSVETDMATEAINQKFVQSLAGISNINLDRSIFSNPAFSSLIDFSNPLTPEQNIGRPNPFLPIGTEDESIILDSPDTMVPVVDTTPTNSLPARIKR